MVGSVLYLVPDFCGPPGGIARHSRIVSQALLGAGADLTVLAMLDSRNAHSPDLRLRYVPCGGVKPNFAVRVAIASRKHPDLVLVGHPYFSPLGQLGSRLAGAPLVVFAHGTDVWEPMKPLRRRALQSADRIICVSAFTAQRAIAANGLEADRTRVLYHCLDPDLEPQVHPNPHKTQLSLLTVARLSEAEKYKGHDQVIRALASLLLRHPEVVYDVVGDGDGRARLERLSAGLGVAHAVRFHGTVPEDELARHYAQADIFVMPSRGEGFGFVFLEAMANGVPVIAGNQDAAREVVEDGQTGLLVDPSDVGSLTGAIEKLLDDPAQRRVMGRRAAAVVQQRFSYARFRQTLVNYLRELTPSQCQPAGEPSAESIDRP